jgi:vancomycin permeability regulator SanA
MIADMTILSTVSLYGRKLWAWVYRPQVMVIGVAALLLVSVGPCLVVRMATAGERYASDDLAQVPQRDTALVLGAGVLPDGTPTPYLKWRVQTGVALYKAGKVHKVLMSGDNSNDHYNEPLVMKQYAISLGMNAADIILDYAGFNTYDSCYRVGAVFKQKSVTVVSQAYHVPRAVATCQALGADAIGVSAQRSGRDFTVSYLLREILATNKAVFQMLVKPQPTVGGSPVTSNY